MYGWRGRLGMIIPFSNTIVEPELANHLPEGVSVHGSRVVPRGGETIPEQVETMAGTIPWALEGLQGRVDVFGYACMSTSLVKREGWQKEYAEHAQGVPFVSAGECMVASLTHVGAKKIGVFSPFFEDVASLVPGWFGKHGFDVVRNVNMPFTPEQVTSKRSADLFRVIREKMSGAELDALLILATDLETFSVIEALEADFGIPVISTNLAMLWAMLNTIGIRDNKVAPGLLFRGN